jgi:SAM-dependent methyltransferase
MLAVICRSEYSRQIAMKGYFAMTEPQTLEKVWDLSYPTDVNERLWPEQIVPMVEFARGFFRTGRLILDLPCGDGKNSFALAEIGPVVAADSSERAVAICSARRTLLNANVGTMRADAFKTPFSDASFDNIFCCDLLGHLPNPDRALHELRRILSATGSAIVTLFTERDSVLEDARMKPNEDGSYTFRDNWYFRFYSEEAAQRLCVQAGFNVVSISEFSWWEDPHPGYREYRHRHSSWALALRRA